MLTTQEIVTEIKEEYAPKWGRTRILAHLNWAQNYLFKADCFDHIFLNDSDDTFPYPFLSTTAGTLKYYITGSNLLDSDGSAVSITYRGQTATCRKVKNIFISISTLEGSDYDRRWYGEKLALVGVNEYYSRRLYSIKYYSVPVRILTGVDADGAYIVFGEDPETETDKYYVEFYVNPPELTSESISMVIDTDHWKQHIIDSVVGAIEKTRNGSSEKLDTFMKKWKRDYVQEANSSQNKWSPVKHQRRECG